MKPFAVWDIDWDPPGCCQGIQPRYSNKVAFIDYKLTQEVLINGEASNL